MRFTGSPTGSAGYVFQAAELPAKHPAFGDFPHDGYLNELLFRLIGRTASPTDEALHQVEPLMVGRGIQGYLLHVFQAKAGKGKLLASGLGLLGTNPEAVYLLDQFIRYARSPEFQPQGTFDPNKSGPAWQELTALTESLNGWGETLGASECRPYSSFLGQYPMCLARQTDGASRVAWKTTAVPKDLDPAKTYAFRWMAGMGYANQPSGKFTLSLGDQPLLDLDVALANATWQGPDGKVVLKYSVKAADGIDSSGLMELTLPGSMLKPGERAELRVTGSASNSQRWFGLYEVR